MGCQKESKLNGLLMGRGGRKLYSAYCVFRIQCDCDKQEPIYKPWQMNTNPVPQAKMTPALRDQDALVDLHRLTQDGEMANTTKWGIWHTMWDGFLGLPAICSGFGGED